MRSLEALLALKNKEIIRYRTWYSSGFKDDGPSKYFFLLELFAREFFLDLAQGLLFMNDAVRKVVFEKPKSI